MFTPVDLAQFQVGGHIDQSTANGTPLFLVAFLRPLLRTVQQAQQLDALAVDAIDHDERCAADDEFAGAWLASNSAQFRVLNQLAHLVSDSVALLNRCAGAVLGDEVNLLVAVRQRFAQPDHH